VINAIFKEYLDDFLLVYLDDLLIYLKNRQEHYEQVRQVFYKLQENDLFAKLEKYKFEKKKG
jgi:hypothetical protein